MSEELNRAARRRLAREAGVAPHQVEREEARPQSGFRLLQDCYICTSYVEGMKKGAYQNFDSMESSPGYRFIIAKVPKAQRAMVEDEMKKVFVQQSVTVKMLMDNATVKKIIEFGTKPMLGKLKNFHIRDAPELVVLHQTSGAW